MRARRDGDAAEAQRGTRRAAMDMLMEGGGLTLLLLCDRVGALINRGIVVIIVIDSGSSSSRSSRLYVK